MKLQLTARHCIVLKMCNKAWYTPIGKHYATERDELIAHGLLNQHLSNNAFMTTQTGREALKK